MAEPLVVNGIGTAGRARGQGPRPRSRPPACDPAADFAVPLSRTSCPAASASGSSSPARSSWTRSSSSPTSRSRCSTSRSGPSCCRLMLDLRRGARPDLPVHHPRPVAGLGHRRPDRGHVPRQDHGDRPGRGGHPRRRATRTRKALVSRLAVARPARRRDAAASRTILEGETPDAAHVPTGCRFHPRCPVAFDRCRVEEPPLFDVGGGQSAACWLAEGGQVGATSPSPAPTGQRGPSGRRRPRPPQPSAARVPPAPEVPMTEPTAFAPARIADLLERLGRDGRRPSSGPSATRAAGGRSPASGARTSASATSSRPSGAGSPAGSG